MPRPLRSSFVLHQENVSMSRAAEDQSASAVDHESLQHPVSPAAPPDLAAATT
jgi:hypothetical protein